MSKKAIQLGEGVSVHWMPVNQAWAVMLHTTVKRVIGDKTEAIKYGEALAARQ